MTIRHNLMTDPRLTSPSGYASGGAGTLSRPDGFSVKLTQSGATRYTTDSGLGLTVPSDGTYTYSVETSEGAYVAFWRQSFGSMPAPVASGYDGGRRWWTWDLVGVTAILVRFGTPGADASTETFGRVLFEAGPVVGEYFDGGTTSTLLRKYSWDGTANASASTAVITEIETNVLPGEPPTVEVALSDLPSSVDAVTVRRTAGGVTYDVRGAVGAPTAGALTRIDYEAPFNTDVTYRAEMFSEGLSIGFTDTAVTQIGSKSTWLHNPLNPAGAVNVVALSTAAKSLSRPVPGAVTYPIGRRVGVIIAEDVRRGLADLVFDVYVSSTDDADKVQAMIGTADSPLPPVVCIRKGSREGRMRIPSPLYLGVLDIKEEDVDIHNGGPHTAQRMTGDEVDPPLPGLYIPLLTNDDLKAYYSSNDAMAADNATNAALSRRYDLAGFAS